MVKAYRRTAYAVLAYNYTGTAYVVTARKEKKKRRAHTPQHWGGRLQPQHGGASEDERHGEQPLEWINDAGRRSYYRGLTVLSTVHIIVD